MTYPAHTMKAAKITGLDPIIVRALELVRDGLRSGEIPAEKFAMKQWCGTTACIGGWMTMALRKAERHEECIAALVNANLYSLFYPMPPHGWGSPPDRAALAIDRFLSGKTPWGRS